MAQGISPAPLHWTRHRTDGRRPARSLQVPPKRVTTALKCVRTGRFDKLRLLHLADLDDNGTSDAPLKALKTNL